MDFLHLGIPTKEKLNNQTYNYVEKIKLYVTDSNKHPLKLQFVWAEPDSPLPKVVREENHLSIRVENIEEGVKTFDKVVFEPVTINENLKLAFAVKDGVLFELMEIN